MLDKITQFYSDHHVMAIGVVLLVVVFLIPFFLKTSAGEWRWKKTWKPPKYGKNFGASHDRTAENNRPKHPLQK